MQNINDFDISKIIKSLNKIGLASVAPAAIIGAGAATQPKNEPYRNGGKIKPKSSNWEIVSDNEWEIMEEGGSISEQGYRDDSPYRNRESIDINTPNGLIDMSNTGIPLLANGRYLPPYSGMHKFNTNKVKEIPIRQNGGSVWEILPDNEWEVLNDAPIYQQGGKVVSEIWQDVTGTPWSEAKKLGLTKGGYDENIALRKDLLSHPDKYRSTTQQSVTPQVTSSIQEPMPTYQWSNTPATSQRLAIGSPQDSVPVKQIIKQPVRQTSRQPLPNLLLITNPIDSPYFQAPSESTQVSRQLIKKPVKQLEKPTQEHHEFAQFASNLYNSAANKINETATSAKDYAGKVQEIVNTIKKEGLENAKEQIVNYIKKPEAYESTPQSYTPIKQEIKQKPVATPNVNKPSNENLDTYHETVNADKDFTINTFSKDLTNKKLGVRNRMDNSDIKGNPLFYTYAPFKKYNEHVGNSYGDISITNKSDSVPVIVYEGDKLKAGVLGDYKNTNTLVSPTHRINNVSELIINDKNTYHEGIKQKQIKIKTDSGDKNLPIGIQDSKSNKFETWSGGHLLVENPNTHEVTVLHGRSNQLKDMFSKYLKQNNLKSANIMETDHKSYSLVKTPKNGVMKGSYNRMLDNYNTASSGSGNFVYEKN
jgi:hypothetical protein